MEFKGARRDRILALLEAEGGLSPDAVARIQAATGIPEADIYGAGSFYELLAHADAGFRICEGLSCEIAGAGELAATLESRGERFERVSCLGQCDRAPVAIGSALTVELFGRDRGGLSPDDPALPVNLAGTDVASYEALRAARDRGPEWVLQELAASGLQGRGGAGFPAHIKWSAVRSEERQERYVIVNADEGEPGTFKDREVMLQRPHRMLEGTAIAAHTVGAKRVFIYVRGEFPAERASLEGALAEARPHLGDLEWTFVRGHGAYICGEETALIESIEGRRGMPRLKPPYPTQVGLFGMPTLVNNVETLACVPSVLLRGGEWFRAQGRSEAGSKLYCVSGHVNEPGVYELPLGVSMDELAEAAGGYQGMPMAFSPGGASSGFLPMSERARPLDFTSLTEVGSMLGSAGVVVINDSVDPVAAARMQAVFFERESCGQCAPCRLGARYLTRSIDRYLRSGDPAAFDHLEDVAWEMEEGSICGLGMTAPLPLVSLRRHFPKAFAMRSPEGKS
jgi:NADH:ubiquinone oxidoreductase subunit F (NADH-binding)